MAKLNVHMILQKPFKYGDLLLKNHYTFYGFFAEEKMYKNSIYLKYKYFALL